MLDMLGTKEIKSLLQDIAHMMEVILSLGVLRNKTSFLVRVQKLSIELWLLLLVKWYGYSLLYKT